MVRWIVRILAVLAFITAVVAIVVVPGVWVHDTHHSLGWGLVASLGALLLEVVVVMAFMLDTFAKGVRFTIRMIKSIFRSLTEMVDEFTK